jgi:hypothetical protein
VPEIFEIPAVFTGARESKRPQVARPVWAECAAAHWETSVHSGSHYARPCPVYGDFCVEGHKECWTQSCTAGPGFLPLAGLCTYHRTLAGVGTPQNFFLIGDWGHRPQLPPQWNSELPSGQHTVQLNLCVLWPLLPVSLSEEDIFATSCQPCGLGQLSHL